MALSFVLSVLFITLVVYTFISDRRLDRQIEKEKQRGHALDRIILLERRLLCLIIEEGALDIYDQEVQGTLRGLIVAEKRYMKKYGVDWKAGIAKKMALLREV